ncbi:MAG: hypothetical protein V4812_09430 [Pseudomonadota bacterium]
MDRDRYTALTYRLSLALLFAMGTAHVLAYWFYQPDDAFIYLVYVKNLITGNGPTFNGEWVEGFSSVSWTLLCSLLAWPGLDPLQGAKLLGLASYGGLALLLLVIQRHLLTAKAFWPPVALLLMLFSFPLLALWAPAAMEGILFALLITASCFAYFRASQGPSLKPYALAGLLFALLAFTRPEGAAFIGAVLVYEASRALLKKQVFWPGVGLNVLVFASLLIALLLWRYSTYGEFLPTTVSAKTGNLALQLRQGAGYVARFTLEYFYLVGLYLVATLVLIVQGGKGAWWAWISFIFVGGYTAFNLLAGGDWMIGYRFIMPITPLLIGICALALRDSNRASVLTVIGFAGYSLWLTNQLHGVAANERLATEGDIIMGKHIAAMNLPSDSKIAVVDAGAIPYFAGLPTIDMVGLNNRHISKVPGGFMAKWDNDYVLSEKPAVIQLHTLVDPISKTLMPSPDFRGTQLLFHTEAFQRWYQLDSTSRVPHLFIRRSTALQPEKTFYGFTAQAQLDDTGSRLTLTLEKTGEGSWSHNPQAANAVSWQVMVISNAGKVLFQNNYPLPNAMQQGDSTSLSVLLPPVHERGYRILACPALPGAVHFPQCHAKFPIELSPTPQQQAVYGELSFADARLDFAGWSLPEDEHIWSLGKRASIAFTLENTAKLRGRLILNATAYDAQQVTISLNRQPVFSGALSSKAPLQLTQLPYIEGRNRLDIETPDSRAPGLRDPRQLGLRLRSLRID